MWNFKEEYDAVIVGSGAAGGIAAWVLVNSGLKVAMLEAGPLRDRQKDFSYFEPWPYNDPYRGFKPKEGGGKIFTANDNDEPYTTPDGMSYNWFRARNVGGRTMFWGKFMNRFNAELHGTPGRQGAGDTAILELRQPRCRRRHRRFAHSDSVVWLRHWPQSFRISISCADFTSNRPQGCV